MTGEQIVDLCRRHTLFEWSAQSAVDPIPVAGAKGIFFWTPEGKRFIDFNSQLMCVNIGHGDERVIRAIQQQAATLAYANPFMATEVRARLGVKLAELTPGDIDAFFFTNGGAEANENALKIARFFTGRHKILARYDRWIVLLYTTLSAGVFWLFVNPPWKLVAAHYSGGEWGFLLVFAVVSVLGPFYFYFAGLQHLEPTRAIVASCLEPVFSIVIAAIVLGEVLRPVQTLGIVVVLAAIVLVQWPERTGQAATVVEPIE